MKKVKHNVLAEGSFIPLGKKLFQRKDLRIILPCLVIAAAIFIWFAIRPSGSGIAIVEKDGREFCRIDLGKITAARVIDVGGSMDIKLEVEPGAIFFLHSDCPDQICVRTGKLTKPGQSAVCLPGKVSVRIISNGNQKGYDGYTG